MKKLYGGVVLLMAGITALSLGITAFTGSFQREEAGEFSVVASFYPMYTAALNLTQGIEAVRVTCLAQPQTGCLHDYQLSPDNMITLQEADLLIINGAGAESFLDQALDRIPDLRVADTSAGIPLLETGHDHHHEAGETHEETGEEILYNEHIWMSPSRYAKQVENLPGRAVRRRPRPHGVLPGQRRGISGQNPGAGGAPGNGGRSAALQDCVTFHDSLAYLAEDLQLRVAGRVGIGEENTISASELGEIADAIRAAGAAAVRQAIPGSLHLSGPIRRCQLHSVLDAAVLPAGGTADKDRWTQAMDHNAAVLEAIQGAGQGQQP